MMSYFKKAITILLVLVLSVVSIHAQENENNNAFELKLKGDHDFYFHLPLYDEGTFLYPISSPKMINRLGLNFSRKKMKVVTEWELRTIPDVNGQQTETTSLIPLENYLKYEGAKMNASFGLQKFAWGMADRINPTNNINPLDYNITGFEQEQIPVLSAAFSYFPNDKWKIEAIYLPYDQPDAIFWNYSEAIPAALFAKYTISDFDFINQTPVLQLVTQDKNISELSPEYGLKSGIYAGKLNYYSSGIDWSLSYVYDFDSYFSPVVYTENYLPGITTELENKINQSLPPGDAANLIYALSNTGATSIAEIDLKRKRIHRLGANAKTIIGRFGWWLEACYSITEQENSLDYTNRGSDLSFVLGTDFFYGPNDRFYANIQYTGKWVPDFYTGFYTDYPDGLPSLTGQTDEEYMQTYYYRALTQSLGFQSETWQHGVAANLNFSFFNERLKTALVAYLQIPQNYDNKEKDRCGSLALLPSIDYSPGNSLHFKLGAYLAYSAYKNPGSDDIRYDDKSSMIGLLNPYNNIYLKVSYSWNHNL